MENIQGIEVVGKNFLTEAKVASLLTEVGAEVEVEAEEAGDTLVREINHDRLDRVAVEAGATTEADLQEANQKTALAGNFLKKLQYRAINMINLVI